MEGNPYSRAQKERRGFLVRTERKGRVIGKIWKKALYEFPLKRNKRKRGPGR